MAVITVRINRKLVQAKMQMEQSHSYIDRKWLHKLHKETNVKYDFIPVRKLSTNKSSIEIKTTAQIDIGLINRQFNATLLLASLPKTPVILGRNFFRKHNLHVNSKENNTMKWSHSH